MNSKLLAWSAALTLVLTVGCGPSQTPETREPPASEQVREEADDPTAEAAATCKDGQQTCMRCDGSGTYCATRCFLCADPAQDDTVEAAATCRAGEQLCPKCDGSGTYCATRCFLCANP